MNQLIESPVHAQTWNFGEHAFRWGEEVVELRDSSPIRDDVEALRQRMTEDGYLYIRGFHPREKAERAANAVLSVIGERGGLEAGSRVSDGLVGTENRSFSFFREVAVAHSKEVLDVVDGRHSFEFFDRLMGGPTITFDKRWLRAIGHGGHNHFHYDSVYVGRGTLNRYTMWTALTNIPLDNGPLVIALGSDKCERLKQTYGSMDMDRDLIDPVFETNPREIVSRFGFKLATAHFQPGDCIIFGLFLLHSSAPNLTNRYRISIDTRYQLATDPKDERFFGANGQWLGNYYNKNAKLKPMAELRREWGV
jgi:hypothetical protein